MQVDLLHHTPLWVASKAIRKCWASEDRSDTAFHVGHHIVEVPIIPPVIGVCGEKDKALIYRVGNKNKHSSTLEHLNYSFDIDGISRACLQELARHRHTSLSVKSTRYTLKELKEDTGEDLSRFIIDTRSYAIHSLSLRALHNVREELLLGKSNDEVKYLLPEAYKTSLVWTINARSLQNFLSLRTDKAALWEIRELAYEIYKQLPEEHQYLFTEFVKGETDEQSKE
jgi:thymidylate synthase (FAD)